MSQLLQVRDLHVHFGNAPAVRGVSFDIDAGETVALVGESGSGKSVTALSVLQLLPYPNAHHPGGSILVNGEEMVGADKARLLQVRGGVVSMIFQEPMTSLNPLHTVAKQVGEACLAGLARLEICGGLIRKGRTLAAEQGDPRGARECGSPSGLRDTRRQHPAR